jgi:hypothetical protein
LYGHPQGQTQVCPFFLRQSFAAFGRGTGKGGGKTLPLAAILTAALNGTLDLEGF